MRIPREEPTGIDPSLWLGVLIFSPCPRLGLLFSGRFLPSLSIESLQKPGIAYRTIPGGSGQRHKKIRDCCKMGILQQSLLSGVYSIHKFQEVLEPFRGVLIHTGVLQHLGEYPSGLLEEKIQGVFCREGVLFL